MSAQILFMPNKLEEALIDYFQSERVAKVFGCLHTYATMMRGPFYKFKEKCKHRRYREGDSFAENLKMSKRAFNPAFDVLVNYHKSKTAYMNSTDKFAGKLFCSYFERTTKLTYYIENKELVDELINSRKAKLSCSPSRSNSKIKEVDVVTPQPKNTPFVSPTGEQNVSSTVLLRNTLQAITSFADQPSEQSVDQTEKVKLSSKEMVNTWNSQMEDQQPFWDSIIPKLQKILQTYFGGDLQKFKNYTERLASNKFLAGKASSTYKLCFFQAIKPEFLEANLHLVNPPQQERSNLNNQAQLLNAYVADSNVKLYTTLTEIQSKKNEKNIVDKTIASLSEHEVSVLSKEWEADYSARNPNCVDDYFSKMLRRMDFEKFLERKIRAQLGLRNEEQPQQELLAA